MFNSTRQMAFGVIVVILVVFTGVLRAQGVTSEDSMTSWLKTVSSSPSNVLFLIADDLRPKLGCYGENNMVTPNIDHLASKSVLFKRAYSQQALCGPSRTSFLTGRRPDTTRVLDLHAYWRDVAGDFTTLPQFFKNHGYVTQGVGKIFHPGTSSGGHNEFPESWSKRVHLGEEQPPLPNVGPQNNPACDPVNVTRTGFLQDSDIASFAIEWLGNYSANHRHQPFFLAVGFHKPHLPFRYPAEFESLYPMSNIHLAEHRTRPENLTELAWSDFEEIRNYHDVSSLSLIGPDHLIPDDFQLGENGEWCKHTNFDIALKIPYMLHVPGVTSPLDTSGQSFRHINALAGERFNGQIPYSTNELVEAVDLFPTITELAGLEKPQTCPENSQNIEVCTEGTSLVPLLRHVIEPSTNENVKWKDAVYSQYPRENKKVMGYTMKTDKYRLHGVGGIRQGQLHAQLESRPGVRTLRPRHGPLRVPQRSGGGAAQDHRAAAVTETEGRLETHAAAVPKVPAGPYCWLAVLVTLWQN
ncbi:hypothetical protein C0Q70_05666 [Pomacea canaliculata]|uniref:Sulfatase N-terminal domain-containing protein n=1 Tax=Pomacea canaliculata TaxID=400727 RepID=A0A2T7PLW6_POMCA|nr:hypothetical protein C0Q70_05666 [Pomacea canaliculata]